MPRNGMFTRNKNMLKLLGHCLVPVSILAMAFKELSPHETILSFECLSLHTGITVTIMWFSEGVYLLYMSVKKLQLVAFAKRSCSVKGVQVLSKGCTKLWSFNCDCMFQRHRSRRWQEGDCNAMGS